MYKKVVRLLMSFKPTILVTVFPKSSFPPTYLNKIEHFSMYPKLENNFWKFMTYIFYWNSTCNSTRMAGQPKSREWTLAQLPKDVAPTADTDPPQWYQLFMAYHGYLSVGSSYTRQAPGARNKIHIVRRHMGGQGKDFRATPT